MASHPDLAAEQAYIDNAYRSLERSREDARIPECAPVPVVVECQLEDAGRNDQVAITGPSPDDRGRPLASGL